MIGNKILLCRAINNKIHQIIKEIKKKKDSFQDKSLGP